MVHVIRSIKPPVIRNTFNVILAAKYKKHSFKNHLMKKVLLTTLHRPDRTPSQRFRIEEFIPYLEEHGFKVDFSYLLNAEDDKLFYSPGNLVAKARILAKSTGIRLKNILLESVPDIVFVQREAFMLGTAYFERQLKKRGAKLIFDFDDAIWLQNVSEGNKRLGFLKNPQKTNELINIADLVFAGNEYLAAHARNYTDPDKVVVVPTTIDTKEYKRIPQTNNEKVCIGWSGSVSTVEHFKVIIPTLKRIRHKYGDKVFFKLIGDKNYREPSLDIEGLPWQKHTEVPLISSFDIGIMPLPDDEWSRGKCGLKGLQYMALEVPTIMSAVGVNKNIIQDGSNGFLAATEDEWFEKLCLLIEDSNLIDKIGKAGRATVVEKYSIDAWKHKYLQYFNTITT